MAKRILIVEDEPLIRENYTQAIRKYGYEVTAVADRATAMSILSVRLPDLVILDVSLKDDPEGGFELCRSLRSRSTTLPIIFLTALDSELDKISGIRLDADDYLTKDVSLQYLMARIAALFRRNEALTVPPEQEKIIQRGQLKIDCHRLTCHWGDNLIPLTLTEFWMVYALADKPGHVKDRDQLMQDAKAIVDDSTVTSHIKRIRKKFVEFDDSFDGIDTVYGMGYRWNLESHSAQNTQSLG
ncbi:MAG: proteobacterial dedicated sortase system response regulator [Gammaproteobacteria bacterium]|nr:MAG: proteobacterial dedicated sortase system response regulator [Gammaproteobacteria bacterium]